MTKTDKAEVVLDDSYTSDWGGGGLPWGGLPPPCLPLHRKYPATTVPYLNGPVYNEEEAGGETVGLT